MIHSSLRRSLETIVATLSKPIAEQDRAGFAEFGDRFAHFLQTHHDGEEEIIFPALSAAAERKALPDLMAILATWRAEHTALVSHLRDFETACTQFRRGGASESWARSAVAVRDGLFPHLDAEEAVYEGPMLADVLTAGEMNDLAVASAKHGQQVGGPKVLMMCMHGLSDDEQRAHFSELPWLVRKVLIKRVWARSFRDSVKYAHNPSVVL